MARRNNDPRKVTAMCDACRRDLKFTVSFSFLFIILLLITIPFSKNYLQDTRFLNQPCVTFEVCECVCVKSQTLSCKHCVNNINIFYKFAKLSSAFVSTCIIALSVMNSIHPVANHYLFKEVEYIVGKIFPILQYNYY